MFDYLFIHFLAIANLFIPGQCDDYQFTMEYVSNIYSTFWAQNVVGPRLPMDEEKRIGLCTAARLSASIDPVHEIDFPDLSLNPQQDFASRPYPLKYTTYPEKKGGDEFYEAIWCRSIPHIWLRVIESPNKIMIIMIHSRFVDEKQFKFDPIKLESYPTQCSDNLAECGEEMKPSLLQKEYKTTELLHICMNAKKHIKPMPKLISFSVVRKVFEFTYANGEKENQLAIECPSSPIFYAYFGTSESHIKVVHVEENSTHS